MNLDKDSPLFNRITSSDEKQNDPVRCITLPSIFTPMATRAGFYLPATGKAANSTAYGPLWVPANSEATLQRTTFMLKRWFDAIRLAAPDWWDAGKGAGGGLAMSDSITALILVLKSIFQHLATTIDLASLADEELWDQTDLYSAALADYLGALSDEDRKKYRALRGVQGQTALMRQCQKALHQRIPTFEPEGLLKYIEEEKAETNSRAKVIADRIELTLQKTVIEELKREFGADESQWWMEGVPSGIRRKVSTTYEDDKGGRGGREAYFDLLDYRHVIMQNWDLFKDLLGYGKPNASKEKRTDWINDVNERRKITAHPSSGKTVSLQHLAQLEEYDRWLSDSISGRSLEDSQDSA